jgi:hypothetical protein
MPAYHSRKSEALRLAAILLLSIVFSVAAVWIADRLHVFHPHKELQLGFGVVLVVGLALGLMRLWPSR